MESSRLGNIQLPRAEGLDLTIRLQIRENRQICAQWVYRLEVNRYRRGTLIPGFVSGDQCFPPFLCFGYDQSGFAFFSLLHLHSPIPLMASVPEASLIRITGIVTFY